MDVPYPRALAAFPTLSQSRLSDFDNCARLGVLRARHGRGWSTHPQSRGQLVHRVIGRALREMEQHGEESIPVDVVLDDLLPQALEDLEGDEAGPPLREIAQARVSLKVWAHYTSFDVANFAGIEKPLEATVSYTVDGVTVERTITGRPDLILIDDSGQLAIVPDWKDTWDIPPERRRPESDDKISEEGYFQQRFYALLIWHHYKAVQRATLREFYLRYASGKPTQRNPSGRPQREATLDRYVMPEIEQEIAALVHRYDRALEHELMAAEMIEAGEEPPPATYRPSPGSHCSYCIDTIGCPVWPKGKKLPGKVTSQEEAELAAGRLNVAEAAAKQLRAALRPWVNRHGDVPVKDAKRPRVFGPVLRRRTERPDRDEVAAALRSGAPVLELFRERDVNEIGMHTPEDQHPLAKDARVEEEMLLAVEKRKTNGGGPDGSQA